MEPAEDIRRIGGVEVRFPYKPYPSQISMMAKIIAGLKNGHNCLLESPTGSGKSLALLCSALAWQSAQQELARKEEQERSDLENAVCTCGNGDVSEVSPHFPTTPLPVAAIPVLPRVQNAVRNPQAVTPNPRSLLKTAKQAATPAQILTTMAAQAKSAADDDDFKENAKRFRSPGSSQAVSRTPVQIAYETSAKPVTIKIVSKGPNGELREQTQTVLLLPHVAGQGTGVNGQPLPANPETTTARLSAVNGNAHVHPGTVHVNPVATNVHSGPTVHPNPTTATINPTSDTNGLKITTAPGLVQLVPIQTQTPVKPVQPAQGFQQPSPSAKQEYSPCIKCCQSKNFSPPTQRRKIPKIYFGTRTHKQIAQIIRELRKTYYKDVKMTILASREHTCIHPSVSQSSTKNEGCRDLLDGPGCLFNSNARKINSQSALKYMHGMDSAWDIEDLVEVCRDRKVKACPYYVSRGLRGDSDIIFCPYNYLVDPMIRKTMEINLKGEIIILDEAHNIEDSARESVSKSIEHDSIVKIIKELDDLIKKEVKMHEHQLLYDMCVRLDEFIRNSGGHLERQSFDQASTVWAGMDIVARLVGVGLGPKQFPELQRVFAAVCEEDEAEKRRDGGIPPPKLAVGSQNVLDALFTMLDFLYREELRFVEDYRVAIVRSMSFSHDVDTSGQWLNSRKKGRKQMRQVFTLNFWCLNPAVAFSDFTVVRNVVLTSGTLSPMSSFSSELGMTFPISLEANHVIKDSQVWVGSIGEGPNGGKLQATFKNTETFGFQDELGKLVLEVCKAIPHGVLCFLPSYKMLDKLSERWQTTGLWGEIIRRKKIVAEPRRGDKADFDELLRYFYNVIQGEAADSDSDDDCLDSDSVDGALFLAVCRGKVSEGLDFADNNARAVITVGIPFPNFKDIQVELKRKYNDKYSAQRGLLTGSEWYEIQAYRALNQALGRCIRHRNDWGALIMIDDRFVRQPQKYIKGLSKWVRNKAQTFGTFRQAIASLRNFTQARLKVADTENSIMSTLPTSQGENSALETPVKGNCDPATEEPLKGSNHETTLLKPVTSTPCSNHQTVELPTATPIGYGGRLSPPMSLSNKGENSSHKSMIDTSPNNDTVVNVSNMKTTGMEKSTKDGVNRFFKFCNISQPQNVHVNAEVVSKTEANSAIIKSETNTDIKQEMDISSDINDGKSSVNVNETLNEEDFLMSTPNLFDSDMSDPEAENSKENQKKEKEQEIQPAVKRPLFRRAAAKATKLLKSWIGVDDENGDENDGKAGVKSEHVRKESTDSEYDAPDLHNGTANADGDLDASLNTKRNNRNRKRKVLSRSRGANKRTKGVDFLDDFDKSGQKIQTEGCDNNNKTITCSRCGNLLVSGVEGSEKRKRVPAFLQSVWGKRNPETVFVNKGQTSDNLKPVTSPLSCVKKGLELNSFWDDKSQCCIQYLGCAGCTADQSLHSREITKVTGAIIRLTTQGSPFTAGMMWILASDVS